MSNCNDSNSQMEEATPMDPASAPRRPLRLRRLRWILLQRAIWPWRSSRRQLPQFPFTQQPTQSQQPTQWPQSKQAAAASSTSPPTTRSARAHETQSFQSTHRLVWIGRTQLIYGCAHQICSTQSDHGGQSHQGTVLINRQAPKLN